MLLTQIKSSGCVDNLGANLASGSVRASDRMSNFPSLLTLFDFQSSNGRSQRISTIGQLHIAQLRQVKGCSVNAATAISTRFGGTMWNMQRQIQAMVPVAVQV